MERDCCQWLADLQSDVPSVLETAWKDLSGIVFRVACAYLHRRSDTNQSGIEQLAEDVAQEALADIFNGLDRFSRNSKFTTWAYSVVVNNARELLRKGGASEPHWPSLDDDETATRLEIIPDPQVCDPELQVEEEELVRTVQEVINTRLTERQRAVLLLYQAGHTLPEIATRGEVEQRASERSIVRDIVVSTTTCLTCISPSTPGPEMLAMRPISGA